MIPITLLVFHQVQAVGTEKGFIHLINKCVFFQENFCVSVNLDKAIWQL